MEELKNEETWNKKRIFAALVLIILLSIGGYFFITRFFSKSSFPQDILKSVKGISSEKKDGKAQKENSSVNVKKALEDKINSLKQEVFGLDILEIASSSPQVQKILQDIKSLEQYPTNQVKEICKKICGL